MKIMTVFGTRPVIIRLSLIIKKLDKYCEHILVHTGQNFDDSISKIFFDDLELREPDFYLSVRGETFGEQIGKILIESEKVINIVDLAKALSYEITGSEDYTIESVGTRPGEKMQELLVSEEEMWRAKELDEYFHIPGWATPEDTHGPKKADGQEYSSDWTYQMSVEEILEMLKVDG